MSGDVAVMQHHGNLWIRRETGECRRFVGGRYRQRTQSQPPQVMGHAGSRCGCNRVRVGGDYAIPVDDDESTGNGPRDGCERARLLLGVKTCGKQKRDDDGEATGHWDGFRPRWRLGSVSA